MKKNKLFLLLFFVLLFKPTNIFAQEKENTSFITVINPVRIAPYTKSSKDSIEAQYSEVKKRSLPATWLLSFNVINDKDAVAFLKTFNKNQELGILMEVSSQSAKAAGVKYNISDSWHRSNSIFLSGYSQTDRIKIIDKVFASFKDEFGYYPVSVGAWWIDSFSLDYMSKKYKVIANLNVSDQSGTDGYHVWGTYWSTPYYPNKHNALFPASSLNNKLDVVTLRWAPRDPLNGYISPDDREATRFSTQDYFTIDLSHDYFEKLIRLYTKEDFSQVTIGLEGDFPPEAYKGSFSTQLSIAQNLSSEGRIKFATMGDFANLYRGKYNKLSPAVFIKTDDLLGSENRIFWFQNPKYRIGMVYEPKNNKTKIIDFRSFVGDFEEPFYQAPNKQYDLFSIVPFAIDSSTMKNSSVTLITGRLVSEDPVDNSLNFERGKIIFKENEIDLGGIFFQSSFLSKSGLVKIEKNKIVPSEKYIIPPEGLILTDLKPKIPFAAKSRISQAAIYLLISFFIFVAVILVIKFNQKNKRLAIYLVGFIGFLFIVYIVLRLNNHLYVSQSEVDALGVLKNLDDGKVLIYDKDCLRCSWTGKNKPAAMEGRKDYVGKMSKKQFFYSLAFVLAKNPEEAKAILKNTKTRYIYLAKYEDYIESLSFNPLDIGVRKVYENANAAIYEVY